MFIRSLILVVLTFSCISCSHRAAFMEKRTVYAIKRTDDLILSNLEMFEIRQPLSFRQGNTFQFNYNFIAQNVSSDKTYEIMETALTNGGFHKLVECKSANDHDQKLLILKPKHNLRLRCHTEMIKNDFASLSVLGDVILEFQIKLKSPTQKLDKVGLISFPFKITAEDLNGLK